MLEIKPFVEVLLTEAEFLSGEFNHYMVQNVLANNGVLYRYNSFSANRRLLRKVADTTMKATPATTQLCELRQFLPKGQKIPMEMFHQIIGFFKAVMKGIDLGGSATSTTVVGGKNGINGLQSSMYTAQGNYEAMIHVVWNKVTEEYRLAVPTQRVSKGAVSYDRDHILENEEIILDIHSHNTMGAFFSGTDNNDDKSGFYISGVAGQLDKPKPAFVWRFNNGAEKIDITLEEIFMMPEESAVEVPKEWLDKVHVSYASTLYTGYGVNRSQVAGGSFTPRNGLEGEAFDDLNEFYAQRGFPNRGLARLQTQSELQKAVQSVTVTGSTFEKKSNATGNLDVAETLVDGGDFNHKEAQEMFDFLMGRDVPLCEEEDDTACDMDDLVEEVINICMGLDAESLNVVIKELIDQVQDFHVLNQDGIYAVGSQESAIKAIKDITECYVLPSSKTASELSEAILTILGE